MTKYPEIHFSQNLALLWKLFLRWVICTTWRTETFNVCLLCLPYLSPRRCYCLKKNALFPQKSKKNRPTQCHILDYCHLTVMLGHFSQSSVSGFQILNIVLYKQCMLSISVPHTYFILIDIITWSSKQIIFSQIKCQALQSAIFNTK